MTPPLSEFWAALACDSDFPWLREKPPGRRGRGVQAQRRDAQVLMNAISQQSHKTFRIKQKLAKAQKQNRPIPQWIRLRTGNTIRYECPDDDESLPQHFPATPRSPDTPDEQANHEMLTGSLQQVQRQAEALAQDPPRPLNAFTLFSSFDPERNKTRFCPTAAATSHLGSADLPLSQPHRWSLSSPCLLDEPPLRGIETMP